MTGLEIRHDRYWEPGVSYQMTMTAIRPAYRMSFGSHVELDLAPGVLFLTGARKHSGFSFGAPLLIHPFEFCGLELRPSWTALGGNAIQDYDLAVLLGRRFTSLRAGYRWLRSGAASLDGPTVGMSVRW